MKRICIIHLALLSTLTIRAQDTELGLLMGGNLYQHIRWERPSFKAPNSYHTYLENQEGEGLVTKNAILNAVHFGLSGRYLYKRFTATVEPQYFYQRTYFSFQSPFFVERIIGKRAFRMPIYATYKVFKNSKSPFLLGGFSLVKEKNWDFTAPGFEYYFGNSSSSNLLMDMGNDHFDGMLYNNMWYWNYMVGFGITAKKMQYSFRFVQRLAFENAAIEAKIFQVEMTLSVNLFSTADFTKKHFLYVD